MAILVVIFHFSSERPLLPAPHPKPTMDMVRFALILQVLPLCVISRTTNKEFPTSIALDSISRELAMTLVASSPITISVDPESIPIATTSATSYGCLALDWWPESKCDYEWCPWAGASFLELDLSNTVLQKAIAALAPNNSKIFLRLSGSLCDFVRYDFPESHDGECRPFSDPTNSTRIGYELGSGCLTTSRWDELNNFCADIPGCTLIFGINALFGRKNSTCAEGTNCHWEADSNPCCTEWSGDWNSSNAEALLRYTHDQGYSVYAFEFGNELIGNRWASASREKRARSNTRLTLARHSGIESHITADQYASDFCTLHSIVSRVWGDEPNKPKLVSPDNNYSGDDQWYRDFTKITYERGCPPDAITWHQVRRGILGPKKRVSSNVSILSYSFAPHSTSSALGSTPPQTKCRVTRRLLTSKLGTVPTSKLLC